MACCLKSQVAGPDVEGLFGGEPEFERFKEGVGGHSGGILDIMPTLSNKPWILLRRSI